jgi:tRNA A-37 threonylcarbamoyl transferase component Bud32/DNA-binding NarL/FixJ family response regulator
MRILLIDDDAQCRMLVRHHITCRWSKALIVDYDPVERGALPAEVRALGFDAVLLDHQWRGVRGIDWLADLAQRPGFAPVVYLSARSGDRGCRRAMRLGASAAIGKEKIDHEVLIAALAAAGERAAAVRNERADATLGLEAQRFGDARIPGYRRVRRLAVGQISDLYLAEREGAAELVVIKVARDQLQDNELDHSFKRFLQEHEIVQRIAQPSVVRLHDLGVSDAHAYLVMEYFSGGDLRRRMRNGLTPADALRITRDIARALQSIHTVGVLHRDLKPGNVMFRDDGRPVLIDFGLAKHEAIALEVTDHGMIFGTPHYMSPEQGHGEPIDGRSDLYSLGVMLYEMLTGQKPYTAENPMAIIYMHRKAPLPRLPESLAMVQPLIGKLMAKEPAARFESAAAAAEVIDRAWRAIRSVGQRKGRAA